MTLVRGRTTKYLENLVLAVVLVLGAVYMEGGRS